MRQSETCLHILKRFIYDRKNITKQDNSNIILQATRTVKCSSWRRINIIASEAEQINKVEGVTIHLNTNRYHKEKHTDIDTWKNITQNIACISLSLSLSLSLFKFVSPITSRSSQSRDREQPITVCRFSTEEKKILTTCIARLIAPQGAWVKSHNRKFLRSRDWSHTLCYEFVRIEFPGELFLYWFLHWNSRLKRCVWSWSVKHRTEGVELSVKTAQAFIILLSAVLLN